jgi:hypothetical protein
VRKRATIRESFGLLGRRWRAWRARLRHLRARVALLALFTLGLSEPLICILHCQLWLPLAFNSYFAAQQQHMHHQHIHMAQATDAAPTAAAGATVQPASGQVVPLCAGYVATGAGSDVPFYVPPSPIHDMVPPITLLLIVMLVISIAPAAPPGDPPQLLVPPPLRPPIPIAL